MQCIISYKTIRNLIISFFVSGLSNTSTFSQKLPDKSNSTDVLIFHARTLINLLDYVSQDYGRAVANGKVINANEYSEMIDFTTESASLFDSITLKVNINNKNQINQQLSALLISIRQKKSKEEIATNAQQIKIQLIQLNLIDISPEQYPDVTQGKQIFLASCQSCHGTYGAADGPLSKSYNPPPVNFQNDSLMQLISPLQVFNTARLGVRGTGMRAFNELSDKELWNVAFYIKSLRFQNKLSAQQDSLNKEYNRIKSFISLSDIAHLSDKELKQKVQSQSELTITAIRLHQNGMGNNSFEAANNYLNDALIFYTNGNSAAAEEKALYAYLEGIEPYEQQLNAVDNSIVSELESKMNDVRSAIKNKKDEREVEQKISDAKVSINKAKLLLGEQTYSFWFSFFIAASILLREGLEAVLIIITILSLLKSLHANRAIRWVHGGWMTAVAIGFISWFFTGWLISFGAQNRELMEAFGAMLAVLILIYVGFWLHKKTEAIKWKEFIEQKIVKMLDQGKLFTLAFISFIVVFREAFESVIFLSSMQLQVDNKSRPGIWMGALAAICIVILVSNLLLKFSVKIPIKKLFQYSAIIIMIMAIVLAGQSVHAFQESGWISVTNVRLNFHSTILGIYPTVQTYLAQIVVLILILILWFYGRTEILKNLKLKK
ncbi:MAG: FTR1 family protein [Sphingobacteriales bacterium]|nr:FTR1 family protein [Sphingobacteriales bacterium]